MPALHMKYARGVFLALLIGLVCPLYTYAASFRVDVSVDAPDLVPGDGLCATVDGDCTLRAAIDEANASADPDTIIVPESISPIRVDIGALRIYRNNTVVIGESGYPVIDGLYGPPTTPLLIVESDNNMIVGLTFQRVRDDALVITGAYNRVGGLTTDDRCLFTYNGQDMASAAAIRISGTGATENRIQGCFIGVKGNGTVVAGNAIGVAIDNFASRNTIGGTAPESRNIIGGNTTAGLVLAMGAFDNTIAGNNIGIDASHTNSAANLTGIIIQDGATANMIGGDSPESRNLISGNSSHGISILGAGHNQVSGNYIGVDESGRIVLGNGGAGVLVTGGATDNTIGGQLPDQGNLIGGNELDGVSISGTTTRRNVIAGNIIGLDAAGLRSLSNGRTNGHGISLRAGTRDNVIGGANSGARNVISGQAAYGIHIADQGTSHNGVIGNFIGTDPDGYYTASNGSGIVISDGATSNTIGGPSIGERNIISGNRGNLYPAGGGITITGAGTDYNRVLGNYIGVDSGATRALSNGTAGVLITNGAQHNSIGGVSTGEDNLISGNGTGSSLLTLGRGIHLSGRGTEYNEILGNIIGPFADGVTKLGNLGHNIGIFDGASRNVIGGNTAGASNTIAWARADGIHISDSGSTRNTIRYNKMFANDSLGIRIIKGAQQNITPPALVAIVPYWMMTGHTESPGATIDIYRAASDYSNAGEGERWHASGVADGDGNFSIRIPELFPANLTAIATDIEGNSSAFAVNFAVPIEVDVVDDSDALPTEFSLSQNFPNPFNPTTTIRFSLPVRSDIDLRVFNTIGQEVKQLVTGSWVAGDYEVIWDGRTNNGVSVASGVYFYRLQAGETTIQRKMVLLK